MEGVAKKYSADRFIKLEHEIKGCSWDEKAAKWNVKVQNLVTGEVITDQSDILISARGNLNTPSWPEINGFGTFKGEVMHSAKWNEGYAMQDVRRLMSLTNYGTATTSRISALASSVPGPALYRSCLPCNASPELMSAPLSAAKPGSPLHLVNKYSTAMG